MSKEEWPWLEPIHLIGRHQSTQRDYALRDLVAAMRRFLANYDELKRAFDTSDEKT